jgi:hypothetical protein
MSLADRSRSTPTPEWFVWPHDPETHAAEERTSMDPADAISSAAVQPATRTNGITNGSAARAASAAAKRAPRAETRLDLAEVLRRSLDDARGNPKIRERLAQVARDPVRVDQIARTLGPGHAVIRELSRLRERPISNSAA